MFADEYFRTRGIRPERLALDIEDLEGKVALITRGTSGLGLAYAKEILRLGAEGVCLVDIDTTFADRALSEIEDEFGDYGFKLAIFVKADAANFHELEEAFKETVDTFERIDIVINYPGILNEAIWESLNMHGMFHGITLGIDYLRTYRQDNVVMLLNILCLSDGGESSNGRPFIFLTCGTRYFKLRYSGLMDIRLQYERTGLIIATIDPENPMIPWLLPEPDIELMNGYEYVHYLCESERKLVKEQLHSQHRSPRCPSDEGLDEITDEISYFLKIRQAAAYIKERIMRLMTQAKRMFLFIKDVIHETIWDEEDAEDNARQFLLSATKTIARAF